MPHPLDGALARVERARKHIDDARAIREGIVQSQNEKDLSETHGEIYDAGLTIERGFRNRPIPTPVEIRLCLSDAVHNLRCALDYLVFELACLDHGSSVDGTQFPICDSKADILQPNGKTTRGFDSRKGKELRGLTPSHVSAIEALQPYRGAHWTKVLRDISNPDKHRVLNVTLSKQTSSIVAGTNPTIGHRRIPPDAIQTATLLVGPTGKRDVAASVYGSVSVRFPKIGNAFERLTVIERKVRRTIQIFTTEF